MATIASLVGSGDLEKVDPQLEPQEQEQRLLYVHADVIPRLENELPSWPSVWKLEQDPQQQMDALFEVFCSGETLTFGPDFKTLNHLGEGVWELKTGDLRLFGWFPVRDVMIIACIDTATKIKTYDLYAGYAGQAVRLRNQLDLDDPKFVAGKDPSDVVSNYTYP